MDGKIKSKGFIHTLEAIVATSIVIGVVLFLLPPIQSQTDTGRVKSRYLSEYLQTLDSSGELSKYISENSANLSAIRQLIYPKVGSSYQYSVGVVLYTFESLKGNKTIDVIQTQNNITSVIVLVRDSAGIAIPETIVWDTNGARNTAVNGTTVSLTTTAITPTHVQINFTSSGEYRYMMKKVEIYGDIPEERDVWTSMYLGLHGAPFVLVSPS